MVYLVSRVHDVLNHPHYDVERTGDAQDCMRAGCPLMGRWRPDGDGSEPVWSSGIASARSACGRYVVAFAGTAGVARDGHQVSAEDLVERLPHEGLQAVLAPLDGAFVLACWDAWRQQLLLARDPAGQRSLYYGWVDGAFVFADTLGALRALPAFEPVVDGGALALYLRHGYVPAPHCIYRDVFKLDAGHGLALTRAEVLRGPQMHLPVTDQRPWWSAREEQVRALEQRRAWRVEEALDALDDHVQRAVATSVASAGTRRIGAFLSGGTDSSLVCAVLQSQRALPVPTLGVGFEHPGHDERHWMQGVARHLGVRHETQVLTERDVLEQVLRIPKAWHEPFADTSQIPTLLANDALGVHCRVALTGDGGDELFFGHGAYVRAIRNARLSQWMPSPLQAWLAQWDAQDPERWREGGLRALVAEGSATGVAHHYLMRVSRWRAPWRLVPGVIEPRTAYRDGPLVLPGGDPADVVQQLDFRMELGNGILAKVEHAGRLAGLLPLSPLLDRRLVSFAWQLPTGLKLHEGQQKWILKQLLCRYLPEALVMRPKRGFGPPIAGWLRGPLREWADGLLTPSRLQASGLADPMIIRRMWARFLAGERRWHPHLWTVLMYVQWFEHNRCRLHACG